MAPTTTDYDENSRNLAFFKYIQRMCRMTSPPFFASSVWIWFHDSDAWTRQSTNFVKRYKSEYEAVHSVYCSLKNEHLKYTKTRTPLATMNLMRICAQERR